MISPNEECRILGTAINFPAYRLRWRAIGLKPQHFLKPQHRAIWKKLSENGDNTNWSPLELDLVDSLKQAAPGEVDYTPAVSDLVNSNHRSAFSNEIVRISDFIASNQFSQEGLALRLSNLHQQVKQDKPNNLPEFSRFNRDTAASRPLQPEAIHSIIRKRNLLCIVGSAKMQKTWCLTQLAACATHNSDFLGLDVLQGRALYINFELEQADMEHRAASVIDKLQLPPSNNLDFWHLRGVSVNADNLLEELRARLEKGSYAWLFIDPFYCLLGNLSENDSSSMQILMNSLIRMTLDLELTVAYTDHTPKGDMSDRTVLDMISGSAVKNRALDAVIGIRRHEQDDLNLFEFSTRHFAQPDPITVQFDYPVWSANPDVLPVPRRDNRGAPKKGDYRDVVKALRSCSTSDEIVRYLVPLTAVSDRTIKRWISQAVDLGLIVQLPPVGDSRSPSYDYSDSGLVLADSIAPIH